MDSTDASAMIQLGNEDEIDKYLELGFATPEQWEKYWRAQRAHALRFIDALRKSIEVHQAYVGRCTERLNRVAPMKP